jgi:hypothetical protein
MALDVCFGWAINSEKNCPFVQNAAQGIATESARQLQRIFILRSMMLVVPTFRALE